MFVVVRKCCLGPNCARGHGAPTYVAGQVQDRRVLVAQGMFDNKTQAEQVARNWSQYEATVGELSDALLDSLEPSSAEWTHNRAKRLGAEVLANVGAGI